MKQTAVRLLRTALPPVLCFALVVLVWHLAVRLLAIKPFLLPSPMAVAMAMGKHADQLLTGAWLTLSSALTGFGLSFLCGFLIALLFSQSRLIERSLYPYAIFLQTVPIVAIAPLIVLWIGHGFHGVVAVSFIISLFPVIVNTTAGLTAVEPALLDLFALNNASRWQLLAKLRIPHAVPHMLTGAKISSGLSVIGAIVGDFFAGFSTEDFGLGYYILMTNAQGKTDFLFACIFFCTLLGLAIFIAVNLLSNFIMAHWSGGPLS